MNRKRNSLAIWITLGVGMGAALGTAMRNMGVWFAVGAGIGVALGAAMSANTPKNDKEPQQPSDKG